MVLPLNSGIGAYQSFHVYDVLPWHYPLSSASVPIVSAPQRLCMFTLPLDDFFSLIFVYFSSSFRSQLKGHFFVHDTYHFLWPYFLFLHRPFWSSLSMFIPFTPVRRGTRPIVHKSINIWYMNFISQFPYSNRAFRVDTAKLQTRYQELQRLVHPDFFSQRSQVAYCPPLIIPKH